MHKIIPVRRYAAASVAPQKDGIGGLHYAVSILLFL